MLAASALYFLLLPFLWASNIAPDVDLSLGRILVVGLFAAWGAVSLSKKRLILPEPLIGFLIFLFLGIGFLSMLWAAEPGWTLRKAAFLTNYFLLFFALVGILEAAGSRLRLSRAYVLGAGASAAVGIIQFALQVPLGVASAYDLWVNTVLPPFLGGAFSETVRSYPSLLVNVSGNTYLRASGLFPDPHLFGLYSALGVAFAYGLYRQTGRKGWIWFVLFLGAAVTLSFSRGAYLALAAAVLFGTRRIFMSRFSLRRVFGIAGLLAALCVAVSLSPVGGRALSAFSLADGSNSARLAIWQEAGGIFLAHPFFGVGLGNYPRAVDPQAEYRDPIYAHNLYLDLLVETGLAGAIPFFLLLAMAFARLLRGAAKEGLAEGHLLALAVFLTHSVFETPIFSVHLLPSLLLILAFAFAPYPAERR